MLRNVLMTIAGVSLGFTLIALFEGIGHSSFPTPGLNAEMNYEEVRQFLVVNQHLIPLGSFLMVILGHALGAFAGVFLASRFAKDSDVPAYIVFTLMVFATVANLFMIPHPSWFAFADLVGVLISGYAGLSLGRRARVGVSVNPKSDRYQASRG